MKSKFATKSQLASLTSTPNLAAAATAATLGTWVTANAISLTTVKAVPAAAGALNTVAFTSIKASIGMKCITFAMGMIAVGAATYAVHSVLSDSKKSK